MAKTLRQANKEIYWAWKSMKQRCNNPRCDAYRNYGARGIAVCDEWNEFEPFLEWALENGWEKGLDLDRIDNDSGYCPDNCKWTTRRANINNRRRTIRLTVNGVTKPRTEWERELGLTNGIAKYWYVTHGREYAESRLAEVIECGYKPKDYGRNAEACNIPVVCVDTGKSFPSMKAACKEYRISPSAMSQAVGCGRKVHGLRFEKVIS